MRWTGSRAALAAVERHKVLEKVIIWTIKQHQPTLKIDAQYSNLRQLRHPPQDLQARILQAIELFPCDVLFIHRDAENATIETRHKEIQEKYSNIELPYVAIVPVRMQEAWFLFDEKAIRSAANNPNGNMKLELPKLKTIENLPDPKEQLHGLLRTASGKNSKRLNVNKASHDVADWITDYSSLRVLSAFQHFENDLKNFLDHWSATPQ
jgi:hypothetical protein